MSIQIGEDLGKIQDSQNKDKFEEGDPITIMNENLPNMEHAREIII